MTKHQMQRFQTSCSPRKPLTERETVYSSSLSCKWSVSHSTNNTVMVDSGQRQEDVVPEPKELMVWCKDVIGQYRKHNAKGENIAVPGGS